MMVPLLVGLCFAQGAPAAGADTTRLAWALDDRAVRRLQHPELVVSAEGSTPLVLVDDGSIPEDTANDDIWVGVHLVRRTQKIVFSVRDGGASLGPLSAFLPSSDRAEIKVRTLEEAPGLALSSEAASSEGGAAAASPAASGGGEDDARFARVLWVAIVLFAVAFGYVRHVVHTRWVTEVKPVLDRLDAYLASRERG